MPPASEEVAAVVATLPPHIVAGSLLPLEIPSISPDDDYSDDLPSHPILPSEIVESAAPGRPAAENTTINMETSAGTAPPTSVDLTETAEALETTQQEMPSETIVSQGTLTESRSEETASPPSSAPPQVEQPNLTETEEESVDWADIEEDLSTPDEAELKNIEAAEGDYSAHECMIPLSSSESLRLRLLYYYLLTSWRNVR
jgi:hypothetical protein